MHLNCCGNDLIAQFVLTHAMYPPFELSSLRPLPLRSFALNRSTSPRRLAPCSRLGRLKGCSTWCTLVRMMTQLPSIAKAASDIREQLLRPSDLVEHCLARIEQLEPRVRAWVHVDAAGARREARRQDGLARDDEWLGPLHGIPVGIKDIIDVAGWPTLCGSRLRAGHVADRDATVGASLRSAGAILLGKTVTTEWASFDPPPTRNPWHLDRTPGGSSSGSAAAVATEMCLAALGSQTGGSIIRPAAYCGVCGLKPGYGELPV